MAENDFYSEAHRLIYRHVMQLAAEGKPVDVVTLSEALGSIQKLDYVGGLAYLGALVQNVPTSANIRHYADIVRERSILRQLAATAGEIADTAYNPMGRSAKNVLDEAEAKVLHIAEQGSRGAQYFQILGKLLAGVVDRIETLFNRDNPSDVTGIATGYHDLDEKTSGLQPGDLVIVAGPAVDGQDRAGAQHRRACRPQTSSCRSPCSRWNGRIAACDADDRLRGKTRPAQAAHRAARTGRLGAAVERTRTLERRADAHRRNTGAQRDRGALARAPPAKAIWTTRLVIVDYLQLMEAQSSGENRATEISEISRAMKSLARN